MITIDYKSHRSIYLQIIDSIKELIVRGVWPADYKLPSVRELSRELTVNPNTIQKAFRELEREGYTYTVAGRGTFVAAREEVRVDEDKVQDILARIVLDYKQLLFLGLSPQDAETKVVEALKRETKEKA